MLDSEEEGSRSSLSTQMINTGDGSWKNKILTMRHLNSLLTKNSLELNLVNYNLTELEFFEAVVLNMTRVLYIDLSNNKLVSIDWLNTLQ